MDNQALEKLRKAGRLAARAREYGAGLVKEGVSALEVSRAVDKFIVENDGKPAFPLNLAINDVAAHYTPTESNDVVFKSGDVVKVDVGVHIDGYIGDTAKTVEVGTNDWSRLIKASEEALSSAIDMSHAGVKTSSIGGAIENTIQAFNYKPVGNLTGHAMEPYNLHAGLSVPNVNDLSTDTLKEGMVVAIEPFATNGAGRVAGKKPGNIYRLIRTRDVKSKEGNEMIAFIYENFHTLPFSEDWCRETIKKAPKILRKLTRMGILASYPVLLDKKGGMVSQTEHTVYIKNDGCDILTKLD